MINFSFLLNRENLNTHTHTHRERERERMLYIWIIFIKDFTNNLLNNVFQGHNLFTPQKKKKIYYRCRAHCVAEFVDNWSCRLYTERTLEKIWVKSNIILKISITEGETHLSYLPSLKTFFLSFLLIKYFINIKGKDRQVNGKYTREAPMRKCVV